MKKLVWLLFSSTALTVSSKVIMDLLFLIFDVGIYAGTPAKIFLLHFLFSHLLVIGGGGYVVWRYKKLLGMPIAKMLQEHVIPFLSEPDDLSKEDKVRLAEMYTIVEHVFQQHPDPELKKECEKMLVEAENLMFHRREIGDEQKLLPTEAKITPSVQDATNRFCEQGLVILQRAITTLQKIQELKQSDTKAIERIHAVLLAYWTGTFETNKRTEARQIIEWVDGSLQRIEQHIPELREGHAEVNDLDGKKAFNKALFADSTDSAEHKNKEGKN